MPCTVEYDAAIDAIVMTASGAFTADDVAPMSEALFNHSKFRTNISQLFDITNGVFDVSTSELQQIARGFASAMHTLGTRRRLAFAVSREVDFGKMRQYEVFLQGGPGVEICVFRSLDEARAWLQEIVSAD